MVHRGASSGGASPRSPAPQPYDNGCEREQRTRRLTGCARTASTALRGWAALVNTVGAIIVDAVAARLTTVRPDGGIGVVAVSATEPHTVAVSVVFAGFQGTRAGVVRAVALLGRARPHTRIGVVAVLARTPSVGVGVVRCVDRTEVAGISDPVLIVVCLVG